MYSRAINGWFLLVLLICGGCGPEIETNVLRVIAPEPSSYDPIRSNKAHEMTLVSLIHDSLVHVNTDTNSIEPGLATSWSLSDDARTWVFRLRDDAATPDGGILTSEDVLFSLELYGRTDLNSPRRSNLVVGGQLVRVEAPDPQTLVLESHRPAPLLIWSLAELLILERQRFGPHADSLESWTAALWQTADAAMLMGFGPFYVERRSPRRIELVANPNFWRRAEDGSRLPHLSGIHLTLIDDASVIETRFASDSSYPARVLSPMEKSIYEDREGFEIRELGPDSSTLFFWLNQNPAAGAVEREKLRIFRDPRLRRGIAHAIDRSEVIQRAFLGEAQPLYGPISEAFPWSRPGGLDLFRVTPAENRLDLARELISSVEGVRWDQSEERFLYRDSDGEWVPLGFVLFTTPSPGDIRRLAAETVAAQLGRVGLRVRTRIEGFDPIVQRIDESFNYEACLMFLEGSGHASAMRKIFHSSSGMHFFHPYQQDPDGWEEEVDRFYERYLTQGSEGDLAQVLRLWTENQPIFYLATMNKTLVVREEYVLEGEATSGRARSPLLDRPFVEQLQVRHASRRE